jgi:hypothetical protein
MLRIATIFGLAIGVASAHHPFSMNYDAAKSATLTGKVAKVEWTNPHVVVAVDVAGPDGKTERWMIEGYPPNTLRRQGWEKDTLREGATIAVSGWFPRDAALKIFHGLEVTFADGSKRVFGNTPEAADQWRCATGDCPVWIPSVTE